RRLGELGGRGVVGDQQGGLARGQDAPPPGGRVVAADRQVGAAGGEHAQYGGDLVGALGQVHGDRLAGRGGGRHGPGDAQRPVGERAVAGLGAVRGDQRGGCGGGPGVLEEAAVQCAGRGRGEAGGGVRGPRPVPHRGTGGRLGV